MGGSASRGCTNFKHIVIANARVGSSELVGVPSTVFLPSLHQAVDGTTPHDCRDGGEDCISALEPKEEQAIFDDLNEGRVATETEVKGIVEEEELKVENFRTECTPIHLNNSIKSTESPHLQPRFTAFEIPVHIVSCAMPTSMKCKDSPFCDSGEAESHRPVKTASAVTYSHPRTHFVALSKRCTPHRGPLRKSTSPVRRKTLCQKYPQIYRRARESVFPLVANSTPSTKTNDSTSSFRSESRCSPRKNNASSEWRTNRLGGDTWIHYPSRASASLAARRPKPPQNPSARRLKPIDKSVIPTNPAAGDQMPSPSKLQKPASSMLPPLTIPEVSRVRPTCNRGGGRGEMGLGAPSNRNGGSTLPPPTSFSSPRLENAGPFSPFVLQMEGDCISEELMQRDRLIFRDSRSVGETSYFKQYSMEEIHDSTKR
ncbi:hypothetical protein TcWFU_001500 [Taenia crassiceps]|uniref:Uncharacterized protein n=1 Tax=Taenia crassiceps TaxID=6207 RepID=A0ABR4QJK2_9CEST